MPSARRRRPRSSSEDARPSRPKFEGSVLHKMLLGLIALKIFALIVAFDPIGLEAFELTKAQIGRSLMWPTAMAILLVIWQQGLGVIPRSRLHAFLAAYLLAVALSALFSEVPYLAAFGERGNYFGLTFYFDMAILYLAAAISIRRLQDGLVVGSGILGGAAVTAGYSALQFLGIDPLDWQVDVRRPIGTFGSTVRHAHFLAVLFSLGVAAAVLAPRGQRRQAARFVGLGIAFTALALAGAVGSRGYLIGLAGGMVAFALLLWTSGAFSRRRIVQVSAALTLLTIAALALLITTPVGQRANARVLELAAEERLVTYQIAIDATAAAPMLGYGPDGFPIGYTRHRSPSTVVLGIDIIENSAHNWMLQAAVTSGLIGAAALVALIVAWAMTLRVAFSREPVLVGAIAAGAGAYWSQGLVSVGTNALDWYAWAALGATAGLVAPIRGDSASRPLPGAAVFAPLGAAIIGLAMILPALDASRGALVASAGYTVQDAHIATEGAQRAVRSDPGRADHWNWLGLALTLEQRWRESGDAFAQAAARAPYDSTFWQNLARSRALQSLAGDQSAGGPEAALAALTRALEVEPAERSSYELAAEIQYSLGRPDASLRTVLRASQTFGLVLEETALKAARVADDRGVARQVLEALLAHRETWPIRLEIARIALAMSDLEAARVNARRALELDPRNTDAIDVLRRSGG